MNSNSVNFSITTTTMREPATIGVSPNTGSLSGRNIKELIQARIGGTAENMRLLSDGNEISNDQIITINNLRGRLFHVLPSTPFGG
jgi:hypothetical protein